MNLPGAVSTARLPERVRTLATLVNFHYAGAGLLLLINLYLAVQLGLAWHTQSASGADALSQGQVALKTADLQARPLQGLDAKLARANGEADAFYGRRLPGSYSSILTELGAITHREGVKLSRGQYAQAPVLENTPNALTEIRMDASLTGDYSHLVRFINALERDRMFFFISRVALTGQQGGAVGLRLQLTTYLRPGAILETDATLDSSAGAGNPAAADADSSAGPAASVAPATIPALESAPSASGSAASLSTSTRAARAPARSNAPVSSNPDVPAGMSLPPGLSVPSGRVRHLPPEPTGGAR